MIDGNDKRAGSHSDVAEKERVISAIQAARKDAARRASTTLDGKPLDCFGEVGPIIDKAYGIAARAWERLCSRELRGEQEVRDAANTLGVRFERDMQEAEPDESNRNRLNAYWNSTRNVVTELEWFGSVYEHKPMDLYEPIAAGIGLSGWRFWEIHYLIALRMIDDGLRAFSRGDHQLSAYLLIESVDAIDGADFIADYRHRNIEHHVGGRKLHIRKRVSGSKPPHADGNTTGNLPRSQESSIRWRQ